MKIGKISFNPENFKDSTKEQFFDAVKGQLDIDKEAAWQMVCEANAIKNDNRISVSDVFTPEFSKDLKDEVDKIVHESTKGSGRKDKKS